MKLYFSNLNGALVQGNASECAQTQRSDSLFAGLSRALDRVTCRLVDTVPERFKVKQFSLEWMNDNAFVGEQLHETCRENRAI